MASNKRHKFKDPFNAEELLLLKTLGGKLATRLCSELGGERVHFPKSSTFDSEDYRRKLRRRDVGPLVLKTVDIVGVAVMHHLCTLFGGQRIRIPSVNRLARFARNEKIIKAFNGSNYAEVARSSGLNERTIRRIVNSHRDGRKKVKRVQRVRRLRKEKRNAKS
jgi:hypothetical protein